MWEESINQDDLDRVYRYAVLTTAAVAYGTTLWLFGNKIERFVSSAVEYGTNIFSNSSIESNISPRIELSSQSQNLTIKSKEEEQKNLFIELKKDFNKLTNSSKQAVLVTVAANLFVPCFINIFAKEQSMKDNLEDFKKLEESKKLAKLYENIRRATDEAQILQDKLITGFTTNKNAIERIRYNKAPIGVKAANIYCALKNEIPTAYIQRGFIYYHDEFMECMNAIEQIKKLLDYQPPKLTMQL